MNIQKFLQIMTILLLFICLSTADGWSQDGTNLGENEFTKENIINEFTGPQVKSRGIRPSIEINFGLNSSGLTSKERKKLDTIGSAFNDERLKEAQFIIEGHTDAVGSAASNLRLSKKRAKVVRDYLVNQAKVSPERLKFIGKGEEELLLKENPNDPRNRRVKFIMGEN